MCFMKSKTVEEIVAEKSVAMTDAQKSEYWYQLSQNIFELLGKKFDPTIIEITPDQWVSVAQRQYPTLTDIKLADGKFFTITLEDLSQILTRDWTNLVPFVAEIGDCDKYASRLYSHLCDYYKVNSIIPVWGDTTQGYHGFNLAVVRDSNGLIARLVEPQTDAIFVDEGPLGRYTPRMTATELGIKRLGGIA